ncbi:MAG TPA: hypothetical protein VM578_13135 [Candidatus Saccharimonadales bacterium]|nr:hypothetical protein [Candidatus Saccharimonadales bacterium]
MTGLDIKQRGGTFSFAENSSAARYAKVRELLPVRAAFQLPRLLEESGSPDQAVLQLETLLLQHPSEAAAAFESGAMALRACVSLFGASQWLGQTLLQNSDLLQVFSHPAGLVTTRLAENFREEFAGFRVGLNEVPLPVLLVRFKRREYVRIFTRELLGIASLPEITAEISALSDVLIEQALAHCECELRRRYQGWPKIRPVRGRVHPARFSVLSLGKLGGNELNYSSDIDLLFLCDDGEDAGAIPISTREFFTRLAQELTSCLSGLSVEGQVFRVDLRLRPQGMSGEMVAGYSQALRYYRSVAQDWELQALLKVRLSAGDRTLAREFSRKVQELIYLKQLGLSAIQTAARSLERIQRGVIRQSSRELDVKNGAGGIREIEFTVQCLQRVHGGVETWLRSGGTLFALQKLHDKEHIGDAEFRELFETYGLLRSIEHRVQCRQGVQSHRLSGTVTEQVALLRTLGMDTIRTVEDVRRAMTSASELCARVLSLAVGEGVEGVTAQSVSLGAPGAERLTRELAARSPVLATMLAADVGDPRLRNLQRFLAAASTGEGRIRTAIKNVKWIEGALPVFAQSVFATDILARHPEDIVALFRPCEREHKPSVADQLRIASRRCLLRSVGRSLLDKVPVWKILRENTNHFDALLQEALWAADPPEGFAIFVVGRFATCELDVVSDADIVFVRSSECDHDKAEQCARSLVEVLSSYTREGSVIAVDTRLRPHGCEGELVASTRQLAQYFETDAKAWETLAFGKLRFIAGAEHLAGDVSASLKRLRQRFATSSEFVCDLRTMRKRLADSGGPDSFKTGPGGLYDLDFLVGLLEARAGLPSPGKQLPERLQILAERELLSISQGDGLLQAVDLFRRVDHAIRIVEGRSRKKLPESDYPRECVGNIAGCSNLDEALGVEMRKVRAVFTSFFGD